MQLGKKQVLWKFLSLTLLSKGLNKTLKQLLLLNKSVERVESCSGAKESRVVERKQAVVEVEFFQHLLQIKILTYSPACPLGLCSWKFITGWRYSPNSMRLSILHSFFSQLLTELKNVNMILKQLQKKNNASKESKKMNYHVGWTIKRSLQLTFSCYISSGCGSFIPWFF